jgi:hypothetical protein
MDVIRAAVNLRLKAQSALAISLEESSYTYAQLLQSAFSISSDLKLFLSNKKQVCFLHWDMFVFCFSFWVFYVFVYFFWFLPPSILPFMSTVVKFAFCFEYCTLFCYFWFRCSVLCMNNFQILVSNAYLW